MNKKDIYPKNFIRQVLIDEIGDVIDKKHPYLAFVLICSGIEFLGRCFHDGNNEWDWTMKYQKKNQPFDIALKNLFPARYYNLASKYKMRDALRNGLLHILRPKSGLGLSEKKNIMGKVIIKKSEHPVEEGGKMKLIIEYFYEDFKNACNKIIKKNFSAKDKMNAPFMSVPDNN